MLETTRVKLQAYATAKSGLDTGDPLITEVPAELGFSRTHNVPNYEISLPAKVWPKFTYADLVMFLIGLPASALLLEMCWGVGYKLLFGTEEIALFLWVLLATTLPMFLVSAWIFIDYCYLRLRHFLSRGPRYIMTRKGLADPQTGQHELYWSDVEFVGSGSLTLRSGSHRPRGIVGRNTIVAKLLEWWQGHIILNTIGSQFKGLRTYLPDTAASLPSKAMIVMVIAHGGALLEQQHGVPELTQWRGPDKS